MHWNHTTTVDASQRRNTRPLWRKLSPRYSSCQDTLHSARFVIFSCTTAVSSSSLSSHVIMVNLFEWLGDNAIFVLFRHHPSSWHWGLGRWVKRKVNVYFLQCLFITGPTVEALRYGMRCQTGINHTCFPSWSWSSFTYHKGLEGLT